MEEKVFISDLQSAISYLRYVIVDNSYTSRRKADFLDSRLFLSDATRVLAYRSVLLIGFVDRAPVTKRSKSALNFSRASLSM
jgi:hypothetical protein